MNSINKYYDLENLFKQRLQCKPARIEWIGGGRNSRIFKVISSGHRRFAVKLYYRDKFDRRDRLGTEFNALNFLWQNNFRNIPRPVFAELNDGIAVFEYIDGDNTQWEKEPLEQLARAGQLMAYKHTSFWHCMDTLRDKRALDRLWESEKAPWKIWE